MQRINNFTKMKTNKLILFAAIICIAASSACKKEELQIDKDKDLIKEYLEQHNIEAKTRDHIYYVENVVGTGEQCEMGDTVAIKYTISTIKNPDTILDQKTNIAEQIILPRALTTNTSVLAGLQVGLPTMKEGGKTTFYIPATYAYGADTLKNNETYANLIFDVELCEIIHRDKRH